MTLAGSLHTVGHAAYLLLMGEEVFSKKTVHYVLCFIYMLLLTLSTASTCCCCHCQWHQEVKTHYKCLVRRTIATLLGLISATQPWLAMDKGDTVSCIGQSSQNSHSFYYIFTFIFYPKAVLSCMYIFLFHIKQLCLYTFVS